MLLVSLLVALAAIFFVVSSGSSKKKPVSVNNFEECAAAGYPVMESYPRQCSAPGGKVFVEILIEERRP